MEHDFSNLDLRHIIADRDSINPDANFILKLHLVPSNGLSLEEAALRVLLILSGRTMKALPYEPSHLRVQSSGHVLAIDVPANTVELALPRFLCRPEEGLTHLLTLISSAAEYNYCDEYWLENLELPRPYVKSFTGPRFGVEGIRQMFGVDAIKRPLVGVIVKPRHGVPRSQVIPYLKEALVGGCDFIADDLLLVDPEGDFSLRARLQALISVVREAGHLTKKHKMYFVNVGTTPKKALESAEMAIEIGAHGLIANGFSMGFGGLQDLIEGVGGRIPVITCNMGSGILTRPRLLSVPGKPTGMSETVVSKLSRLAGADGVHAGTSASECYGADAWGPATRALRMPFSGLKQCFAVAEGDLNVANLWDNIRSLGQDVLLEPTSGILAAPGGPKKAAAAFRELSERLIDSMTDREAHEEIQSYAKHSRGASDLLDHFGYHPPKEY